MHRGERFYAGQYTYETEAAIARDNLARELHGEFANLNFPHIRNVVPVGQITNVAKSGIHGVYKWREHCYGVKHKHTPRKAEDGGRASNYELGCFFFAEEAGMAYDLFGRIFIPHRRMNFPSVDPTRSRFTPAKAKTQNRSGYMGVQNAWKDTSYSAVVDIDKNRISKKFTIPEDAAREVDKLRIRRSGVLTHVNFPKEHTFTADQLIEAWLERHPELKFKIKSA